ncbi:hypothetical protein EGM70_11225 [Enterobacteriaceae bacterium 89]|nr:hypothetical protein [Enterobacteriaceae bacterium 89]
MNQLPEKWVIGDDPQHPVVSVTAMTPSVLEEGYALEEGDVSGISRLSPLLQAIPTALTSNHLSQHNYMEVIINGPLAKTKDGIGYRAFSFGDDGKIAEQAVLMDADKLGNLVNTGLLLQTASVLLAQKHLADINEKLVAIAEDVKKVSEFQHNDRTSKIDAAIKYLRQIAPGLQKGELSPTIRHKLEDFEVQFSGIQSHLRQDIITTSKEVRSCADPDFFGTNGITKKINGLQKDLQKHIVEWKMALGVRICALKMVSLFEGDASLQISREDSLRQDVEEFRVILEDAERIQRDRIAGLSSFTESDNATNANKVLLNKWLKLHLAPQMQQTKDLQQTLEQFSQQLAIAKSEPTRLVVEMENGQPVKLFHAK